MRCSPMNRIVHAGISLKQFGYPKSELEVEQDRNWGKALISQMGIDKYQEFPYGLSFDLAVASVAFDTWVHALNERSDLIPPHIRVERRYELKELRTAELFTLGVTNHSVKDDYFEQYPEKLKDGIPLFERCPVCRAPIEQIRQLKIRKPLMKKRHLSSIYSFQVVLAEWIGDIFKEHDLTGYDFWPVLHYAKSYQGEPILYQLIPNNTLLPMASPPTEFETTRHCNNCKRQGLFLKHTFHWDKIKYYEESNIYYSRQQLTNVRDFNYTAELFGELPLLSHMIIVSSKVYRLFIEHKIKDWSVTPVYLVD